MGAIVALVAVLGLLVVVGSKIVVKTVPGQKYRFHFKVIPALDAAGVQVFGLALQQTGLDSILIRQESGQTVGSYESTVSLTKDITIGEPLLAVGNNQLIITNVEQL